MEWISAALEVLGFFPFASLWQEWKIKANERFSFWKFFKDNVIYWEIRQVTSNNRKVSKAGEEINLYNYLLEPSDLVNFYAILSEQGDKNRWIPKCFSEAGISQMYDFQTLLKFNHIERQQRSIKSSVPFFFTELTVLVEKQISLVFIATFFFLHPSIFAVTCIFSLTIVYWTFLEMLS